MREVSGYNPSKDPRLINCKTECGNERCYAKRYGLFAEKTCPNFVEPKLKTNAERIRSMTAEELGEIFANNECGCCRIHDLCFAKGRQVDCEDMWLDWLKQEAE